LQLLGLVRGRIVRNLLLDRNFDVTFGVGLARTGRVMGVILGIVGELVVGEDILAAQVGRQASSLDRAVVEHDLEGEARQQSRTLDELRARRTANAAPGRHRPTACVTRMTVRPSISGPFKTFLKRKAAVCASTADRMSSKIRVALRE
jgi:hypothetical protein